MNDTSSPKRKMSKWIKVPLVTFGILIVLIYGYLQVALPAMNNKVGGDIDELFYIASGKTSALVDWERPAPKTISEGPSCSLFFPSSEIFSAEGDTIHNQPYSECVGFYSWGFGPGCSYWRLESCDTYAVDDFILTQPELLGRSLHALQEPCAYLPAMAEINKAREKHSSAGLNLKYAIENMHCETGGHPYPYKVIINVRDDDGNVVAQYFHLPKKRFDAFGVLREY